MGQEESTSTGRRLNIPSHVPEDFAHAVATVLLLGIAGDDQWDRIYRHPPERSLEWIKGILDLNEISGLVHADIRWWENQVKGH